MKHVFLFAFFFSTIFAPIFGAEHTFILHDVDTNQTLIQEGDTAIPKSPYCTFNIALSLIGFDTGTLQDLENPLLPFKKEYEDEYRTWNDTFPEKWKASHNPTTWMKHSCVWYSHQMTQKFGMEIFEKYITTLDYGNHDLTGDTGKNNGLTRAWIGSSLRIAPHEQVSFINRLLKLELPVSTYAHECTKAILFVEELPNCMKLYGKTGSGSYANGREEPEMNIGWFVGWVEYDNKKLSFAYMIQDAEKGNVAHGVLAREYLKARLLELEL